MGIFCKHEYGKKIIAKSPVVKWSLHGDMHHIRIRAFQRCIKCGKEKVFTDVEEYVGRGELLDFVEEHYIEGTAILKEEYSHKN